MRIVAVILISFLITCQAHAEEEIKAPVGLEWGMSGEKLIVKFSAVETEISEGLKLYEIKNPPIKIPDLEHVYGKVDKKYGLVSVYLVRLIHDDPYGGEGIELYNKYKEILKGKYGEPESYEYIGRMRFTEKDQFYQCLDYKGCGSFTSFFPQKANSSVFMNLDGVGRGEGGLRITYESSRLRQLQAEENNDSLEKAKKGL